MPDIKKQDGVGRLPSKILFENGTYDLDEFHDVFIEMEDMTEYEPALKLVGTWKEWNRLKRDWPTFKIHIEEWKEELTVLFKSRAIRQIQGCAEGGQFQASKWVAEGGWDKRAGAGRPSKSERERAAKEIASAAATTKEEKDRVLRLINGGSN